MGYSTTRDLWFTIMSGAQSMNFIFLFSYTDDYDSRLVDDYIYDDRHDSGIAQIYINGSWGSIGYDNFWNQKAAEVGGDWEFNDIYILNQKGIRSFFNSEIIQNQA